VALHTDLPIYRTGTELLAMGYVLQRDMPRGFKRTLGEKIVQGCADMLELMALANATRGAERAANIERPLAAYSVKSALANLPEADRTRLLGNDDADDDMPY
jgi:hypothetical protein